MDSRHADCGQTGRDVADDLDAGIGQPEHAHHGNGQDDDKQCRRSAGKNPLQRHEQGDCGKADSKRNAVCLVQRHRDMAKALEHVAGDALDTEQLGELRRGDVERGPRFEPDQDRIRDEVRDVGETDKPAGDADRADNHSQG